MPSVRPNTLLGWAVPTPTRSPAGRIVRSWVWTSGLRLLQLAALLLGLLAVTNVSASPGKSGPASEANKLYDDGWALYEAADYTGAIAKFTEALALVNHRQDAESQAIRLHLVFNIARSHELAYEI